MPTTPSIIDFVTDPQLLDLFLSPAQETLLRALYGLPLASEDQFVLWQLCTGREAYPGRAFAEATVSAGARAGKDSRIAAPVVCYEAIFGGHERYLARGEAGAPAARPRRCPGRHRRRAVLRPRAVRRERRHDHRDGDALRDLCRLDRDRPTSQAAALQRDDGASALRGPAAHRRRPGSPAPGGSGLSAVRGGGSPRSQYLRGAGRGRSGAMSTPQLDRLRTACHRLRLYQIEA